MATINVLKNEILNGAYDERFKRVYVTDEAVKEQHERYVSLANDFAEIFSEDRDVRLFSAPGRTEVGGNHTDHNHGRVLAASINLDAIAVASKNDENIVRVKSRGYKMDVCDITDLEIKEDEKGHSPALVRGMCAGFLKYGYKIGGFDAVTMSSVLSGSGLSSSASVEVLTGFILRDLFGFPVTNQELALIGQYSENKFNGVKRRFKEILVNGDVYIDDYAHHPTQIAYTLEVIKNKYPDYEIIVFFKPDRASRFLTFYKSIATSFNNVSCVVVMKSTSEEINVNLLIKENEVKLIDWEHWGLLPYPLPIVRLLAHTKEDENYIFYMKEEDKLYAIEYYYNNFIKEYNIDYKKYIKTMKFFLFYEYCEWIFVYNKYQNKKDDRYNYYINKALNMIELLKEDDTFAF